jgi:hypothetical protein
MLTLKQLLEIGGYELDGADLCKEEVTFDLQHLTEVLRAVYEQGVTDGFESGLIEGRDE